MCGIVGIAFNELPAERQILSRMRDSMAHRGPDDAGEWWSQDGRVAMGQRRLAIIDLSPGGHQPMLGPGGLCIVFNGEIYNHIELREELSNKGYTFKSASDTEVILATYREWGSACLTRLNGMFAFCIYDSEKGIFFIARDRAGEKPLFYSNQTDRFVFASELKAILSDSKVPRNVDLESLDYYLTLGFVPRERCILKGVNKLPPAHALIYQFSTGTVKIWQYWTLPAPYSASTASRSTDELTLELELKLGAAVKRQLVADVPVGILLSGGIDSSLVTALAARQSTQPVRTFTISFPGNDGYNEAPYARLVANHFSTEHTELTADPASVDLLPLLAQQFDEPLGDSSLVPTYLVSKLIRQHCTVALGGDGGDELFGGYNHYSEIQKRSAARLLLPEPLFSALREAAGELLPVGLKGRGFLIGLDDDPASGLQFGTPYFDNAARRQILKNESRSFANGAPEFLRRNLIPFGNGSALQAATSGDFLTYLPDDILTKVDRASMLNSLEIRAPFLDVHVIEFAFSQLPDQLRATAVERKILLRKLATRLLPRELDLNRKQGFSIPLQSWFQGKWGEYMTDVLSQRDTPYFNPDGVARLLSGQRRGYANSSRLFALVMFELWRRHYKVSG